MGSGGTIWYHPHHHGSTATQVAGGAIIVEPNDIEASTFPDWYTSMDEIVLVVQNLRLSLVAEIGSGGRDELFRSVSLSESGNYYVENYNDMYLVNGEYQPSICLTASVWKKFRMVHSDVEDPLTLTVNGASCSVYLLSKDGVLIHGINNEVPREIPSKQMYFSVASRADIAIQCSVAGTYAMTADDGTIIANLEVTGAAGTAETLTPWNPLRPRYLQSLLFSDVDGTQTIDLDDDPMGVNGNIFVSEDVSLFTVPAGSVQDFTITGTDDHPYHVHVNHFQILDCSNGPSGWSEVGDWIDTADFEGSVRFSTDTFGGKVVIHCHILEHEDEGLMGLYRIEGGCDALQGNVDNIGSECVWDSCDFDVLNSSFSDYDWSTESANYVPATCAAAANNNNNGLIIGLVVGGLCLVLIIVGLVYYVLQKKKKASEDATNTNTAVTEDDDKNL